MDEAAFQAHLQTPHFIKWRDTVKGWMEERPPGAGAGAGSSNIWPSDDEWK